MPTVPIACNLDIVTEIVQTALSGRMGVEVSQPVLVFGDDVVAVAGEVSAVERTEGVTCNLELWHSSNGLTWMRVQAISLPTVPGPFELAGVPVSSVFVRVRYVIQGPMTATTRWLLSATLSSGAA